MGAAAYALNPFSPSYLQGLNIDPNAKYTPRTFDYVYSPPNLQLTGNQLIPQDIVPIQADADWLLEAWYISQYTGAFQIQLTDATGYQLQSGFVNSGALSQSSSDPTVFSPAHPFPASSKILIAIQDLSGATNPLQIVFKGVKLYKVQLPTQ